MEVALRTIERFIRASIGQDRARATQAWRKWARKALEGGASQAHRWAKAPLSPPVVLQAPGTRDHGEALKHHALLWQRIWEADDEYAIANACRITRELRERNTEPAELERCLSMVAPERLREAAKQFRPKTGIGVDGLAFTEVMRATNEALAGLGELMAECVERKALPVQSLLVVMSLLAKKAGGTRAIALIASFTRLLLGALKEYVRGWDKSIGVDGDTGLPGCSLELEAARRHLRMRIARSRGQGIVQLLWDITKFYDATSVSGTVRAADRLNFPHSQLALSLVSHRAPRVFRSDGHCSEIVLTTGRSTSPGCTNAASIARLRMMAIQLRAGLTEEHLDTHPSTHPLTPREDQGRTGEPGSVRGTGCSEANRVNDSANETLNDGTSAPAGTRRASNGRQIAARNAAAQVEPSRDSDDSPGPYSCPALRLRLTTA